MHDTIYTFVSFEVFSIQLLLAMIMGMGGSWNRDVGKMGMGMRYWTGNGNGMGMILREWEGMGTTIIIPAHLYL